MDKKILLIVILINSVSVQAADICHLPPENGPCKAYIPRYYFDPAVGECKEFIYGGCQGNENNFMTKEACEAMCILPDKHYIMDKKSLLIFIFISSVLVQAKDVCRLPPEKGPCKAREPRYYFDAMVGECRMFIYGGCGGNENRFMTKRDCGNKCYRRT
nr:carboxypeptidase inhibitor SmCI-like [Pocillopora verrucosa]